MRFFVFINFVIVLALLNLSCSSNGSEVANVSNHSTFKKMTERELEGKITIINDRTEITFDEGHLRLQELMDELDKYADSLHEQGRRGDYIGYVYATSQMYNYLLAINYKGKDLLDETYSYDFSFLSFNELTNTYHKHVDFGSIEFVEMNHEDFDIEVTLKYTNKITSDTGYLKYHMNYGRHGLTDLSSFN